MGGWGKDGPAGNIGAIDSKIAASPGRGPPGRKGLHIGRGGHPEFIGAL